MIVSGIPQGSVLAPILFLIYISDIGEDLIASTLVYVDDAKVKQSVKSESDVEHLQNELNKLDQWAIANNMEFNKKKFQVLRYGDDEDLKNETSYFTGNYDEGVNNPTALVITTKDIKAGEELTANYNLYTYPKTGVGLQMI